MKIIELHAENVKRLRAVQITPDEHVQVITGKNAQGKSSVLDAIWLALGGGAASKATARPVRDGQDTASVRLDLGEFIVTRTWAGEKSTLRVESAEGQRFTSPQAALDKLVGRLSFDPLAFTQMPPKAQRDALLSLVDLPFEPAELERRRAEVFERRTEIGRYVKELEGQLAGMNPVPDGTPDAEVSAAAVVQELQAARQVMAENDAVLQEAEAAQSAREQAQAALTRAQEQLAAAIETEREVAWRVEAMPDAPDTRVIEERLASLDVVNAAVRAKAARAATVEHLTGARQDVAELTDTLASIDEEKATGLAQAHFPIEGLGFDADGVTYQGVPFSQASSAEQIRVSLAMAMALNPKLRVIRILDGSLLDADSLALIEQMAIDQDYQVWIERVSDGSGVGIEITDGQVAA
ncbi:AAA family ATPase [Cellulomonas taurus]|uniref:AAA family ATPase n=1 Tax=Cellulomonas taurus TaxID=2729175 RepID=UPI00145D57E5|nr:AAA family ATPase [Cellulomonas taurus]